MPPPPPSYNPVYSIPPQDEIYPIPPLHLKVLNLSSPGSAIFFRSVDAPTLLYEAVQHVVTILYSVDKCPTNIRSVTLILRAMSGVAYATSSELDNDHKEIHFSTDYIRDYKPSSGDIRSEIYGVLVHELVHCFQYDAMSTCPGGLIEGIADYVRLKAGFAPPHWFPKEPSSITAPNQRPFILPPTRRPPPPNRSSKWDEGYQHTGFFLDYISAFIYKPPPPATTTTAYLKKNEHAFVRALNLAFKDSKYQEDVWVTLTGKSVEKLWRMYLDSFPPPALEAGGLRVEAAAASGGVSGSKG